MYLAMIIEVSKREFVVDGLQMKVDYRRPYGQQRI